MLPRAAWIAAAAAFVAFVGALELPADASFGVALLAAVVGGVCGPGVGYALVAMGLVPLSLFGLRWLSRTILHGGARMLAVLPLLLVAVTFLFLGAETWQSIGRLHGLPLLLTALLFISLGVSFVSRQVRPDLDTVVSFDDAAALRARLPRDLRWPDEMVACGVTADATAAAIPTDDAGTVNCAAANG